MALMKWKWKTPTGQVAIMGIIFFFVFTAYYMIQGFISKLYGPQLGSNVGLAIYAVFTVFCFVAPPITNKIGSRETMFVGILGYAVLTGISLIYFESGLDGRLAPLVIIGGGVCGMGAALLWTAQGRLMLQYSNGNDAGQLFSIFWGLFNMSAVVGGFVTYGYFASSSSNGNGYLYIIFLVLIMAGAFGTLTLTPPAVLWKNYVRFGAVNPLPHQQTPSRTASSGSAISHTASVKSSKLPEQLLSPFKTVSLVDDEVTIDFLSTYGSQPANNTVSRLSLLNGSMARSASPTPQSVPLSEFSSDSWYLELEETLSLFRTSRMQMLFALFLYTGLNQPYQLVTFGYLTESTLGLMLSCFYLAEIFGAIWAGYTLDQAVEESVNNDCQSQNGSSGNLFNGLLPRRRSQRKQPTGNGPKPVLDTDPTKTVLRWFMLLTSGGYVIAGSFEIREIWIFFVENRAGAYVAKHVHHYDTSSNWTFLIAFGFFLWGLSDAMIQTYCYWLIQRRYDSGPDQSRAIAYFKMVQSAGWCCGFAIVPTYRCAPILQLMINVVWFVISMMLLFLQLTRDEAANTHKSSLVSTALLSANQAELGGWYPHLQDSDYDTTISDGSRDSSEQ